MNKSVIRVILGRLLILMGLSMFPSMCIAIYYGEESYRAFVISMLLSSGVGLLVSVKPKKIVRFKIQDGLAIVTLCWILASAFGALPFYLSGQIPSYTDAYFETMSGFTSTGATILADIEALDNGLLFWRAFTNWIGGMGILVVAVAIFPSMGTSGFQLYKAESTGPTPDRIVPRIKDTAKILYTTYILISISMFILLLLGRMNPLDAAIHTFGSVGTGGYSSKNQSVGHYNSIYISVVITIFMIMCGVNFSLYYNLFKKKWKTVFENSELRLYLSIIVVASILITINLCITNESSLGKNVLDAFFQVGSIISTSGYSTVNFDNWPSFSKMILFFLMFVGGSAGSTSGSIKVIRILIVVKVLKLELQKIFHPRAVMSLKLDGKPVSEQVINKTLVFILFYFITFTFSSILISLEGYDFLTNISAVAAMLGNIGPGFGLVGPVNNFSFFSSATTWLLSFLMLLGRLELFTVLALFSPKFWKRDMI